MEHRCGPIFGGRVIAREDNPALSNTKKILSPTLFNLSSTIILDDNKSQVWEDTRNLITIEPYLFWVPGRTIELHFHIDRITNPPQQQITPFASIVTLLKRISYKYVEAKGQTDIRDILKYEKGLLFNQLNHTAMSNNTDPQYSPEQ